MGGVLAFEWKKQVRSYDVATKMIRDLARQYQIFLRPLGNTVYVCPPFHMTSQEVALFQKKFLDFCHALEQSS